MENTSTNGGSKIMTKLLVLVTVIALGLSGYLFMQVRALKQNPQAVAQKETDDLVAKVGRLVVLPVGETPTVATVSDPAALKDQAFFAKAEKGDKVLIYAQAKKAILYSVLLNKIIDVAPLNIGDAKAVSAPATSTTTDTKTPTTKTP